MEFLVLFLSNAQKHLHKKVGRLEFISRIIDSRNLSLSYRQLQGIQDNLLIIEAIIESDESILRGICLQIPLAWNF